jgi:hypothetical protein
MASSTTTAVDVFVNFVSAALISLFGLNYYAMVWAFVGALVALTRSNKMTRTRAVFYVIFSTFIGALLGTAAAEYLALTSRSLIAVLSLLGGVGWQGMIALLLKIMEGRIRAYVPPPPSPPAPPGAM